MDMNMLFKAREAWEKFCGNHPKFPQFISAVNSRGIPEGAIIDVSITYPDGQNMATNLKVTASDLELFNSLR